MTTEQLNILLDLFRRQEPEVEPTVADLRAGMARVATFLPTPSDARTTPTSAGGVPAEWVLAPDASDDRVILYLHGGGYVMGGLHTHRTLAYGLSRASSMACLLLDYRLAPEHPYPAAVEDALAAYRWLGDQGHKAADIVVAGDSAGGGLTVATLVALRDDGAALPAAGVCISPWADMEGTGDSMDRNAALDPLVQREGLLHLARLYLNGVDPRTPLASPIHADLAGLPPLLVLAGGDETLLDDATRLAERARADGVDVTYEEAQAMFHVWPLFAPMLTEGQDAIDRIAAFVRARTG